MRALLRTTTLVTSLAVLGCGSAETSDEPRAPAPSDPGPVEPACVNVDPSRAGPNAACGVFVSSSLGSDDGPGTLERPVRTLARAFALALDGARRVYACAEVFEEPVEIPGGVALWGGLDCADGWQYVGDARKTTIAPGEPGVIPVRFLAGEGLAEFVDVRAEAADGAQPGESSIAALVLPGAMVEIRGSELVAGDGAAGADGEQGGGIGAPFYAQSGADGLPGGNACTGNVVPGGAPVVTVCEGGESIGGRGGAGRVTYGEDAEDGAPIPPNPNGVHGEGGWGENSGSFSCMSGQVGHTGKHGEHGLGAVGFGRITRDGWEGMRGQDGGDGLPGQGGGGGGGTRGPLYGECGTGQPQGGASGGSGGAGGCGGKGGKGGGSGGASIGLVSLGDRVTIRQTQITMGHGGDGGRGGLWQGGGLGGGSGPGGTGFWSHSGCKGGGGGQGGNGGHGGGGLGGPAIAIAHAADHPVMMEEVVFHAGKGGKGGQGGSPFVTLPGTTGEDGLVVSTQSFPEP